MGQRGPQPLPSAAKRARGTYRPDRAAAGEPAATGKPSCPSWLSADEAKEFCRLAKELAGMGIIGRIDGNALARYARTWCRWRQAEQMLEKGGPVVSQKDRNGKVCGLIPSPFIGIAAGLAAELSRLEQAFGMNPSARSRISVAPAPEAKPSGPDKSRFFDAPLRVAQ